MHNPWSCLSLALGAALVITLSPVLALAQDAIREVRVQFPRGASSTTIKGTITGRETIDYKLGAAAGQRMTVRLTTLNRFGLPAKNWTPIEPSSRRGNGKARSRS